MTRTLVLLGTRKGAFVLESDRERRRWDLRGPYCETWPMNHLIADPATGTIYGAGGNEWFGPAVWSSADMGRHGRIRARVSPIPPVKSPSNRCGLWRSMTVGFTQACSRPGSSGVRMGAGPGRM